MAKFIQGTAAPITYCGGVRIWDFCGGCEVATNDQEIIGLLRSAGAIELAEEIVVGPDPVVPPVEAPVKTDGLNVIELTHGMTKEQISVFALNKFDATIAVKPNKTRDEMLVELQAAADAFVSAGK